MRRLIDDSFVTWRFVTWRCQWSSKPHRAGAGAVRSGRQTDRCAPPTMPFVRIGILTREYPPDVYGGAGVHVDFLVRELVKLADVDVHCMGDPRPGATAHTEHDPLLEGANAALRTLAADLSMANKAAGCDIVHSQTCVSN